MNTIAVMGFGNPCRSDDAIGIYVIEQLKQLFPNAANVSFFDMGSSAFEVLFQLRGHSKIIIVDAALNTSEPAGTIFKLPAEEVRAAPQEDPLVFLHGLKWNQALSYAKKILGNEYPEDITVYLIAVDNTRLDIQLSNAVREAGNKTVELIGKQLASSLLWKLQED